ncbi:hypothetical protein V8D89_013074 [Ganoderma adspersum]
MTTRHRTTSTSRNDYGLWRPSDGSDSDRPRQTMATTQRHNVGQTPVVEAPRKHRSSRRPDPAELLDPSAAYGRHKSSSKDRSSTANQASYYIVPPSPNPSVQHQTNTAHYDLRAYLKQKTEKRSPGTSNEKRLAADEGKPSRSGHRSRHAYPDPAAYNAAVAAAQSYSTPAAHATRDPTSSSRHHRERDKDREKTTRDPERTRTRDPTTERSEDRERRRRREREVEKERLSKDKERNKEKERRKDREGRAAAVEEVRPADAASVYQAYAQTAAVAQRSADKASVPYPDIVRPPSAQPQATAHAPPSGPSSTPWAGLTSAGRGAAAPVPESVYPYASDKDDPPLPIPPPTRRRTSSKPNRSHKATSQQAGQDSGLSSSEQEHERPRATDRYYASREQASILQRGYSSGPSGSENEKAPTIQMERRKHRTNGESSRHKSKTANADAQLAIEPTTSQGIATQWYQRHQRDPSGSRTPAPSSADPSAQKSSNGVVASAMPAQTSVPPSGKPTSSVGVTVSQRAPQIVSIRAGQGPADPHAPLPKVIHSGVTPLRQPDPLPSQQYLLAASRQQDGSLQTLSQGHTTAYAEASSSHPYSSITQGASGSNQQPGQSYPNTMHTRTFEANGVPPAALHGNQLPIPDVVVRPPSTRPPSAAPDLYSRVRSTSASAGQSAAYTQTQGQTLGEADTHRSGGTHAKGPSQDLPSRFPVYEDTTSASRLSVAPHVPSASPKRGLTYPGASAPTHPSAVHVNPSTYQGSGTYDPRSPKPPFVQTTTNDPSRLQTYLSGSPAGVPRTVSAGSSTPKHSPSVRLQSHRNGSNDTITHAAPTKSSPSGSSPQHLPHRPSTVNVQPQLHASSRLDAGTASRQPNASSAYPDIHRYRSPAPQAQGYSNAYASSSAPIVSPSYSTQTPVTANDYQQYGRSAPTPTQGTFAAQQVQASSAQVQARSHQSVDYGHRPEQILATNPLASPVPTAQRIPPRAAPSPAPTGRPARLISSLSSKVSAPLHSAPPRNQTFPNVGSSYTTTSQFPSAHSRTVSDPQYTDRVGTGYASASLPTRGRAASQQQQQQDILLTPSSLAPSMLPQTSAPYIPLARSTSKNTINGKENEKEKDKKRSFFGSLFRSRSSPPKQRDEPPPPPSQQVRERRERNNSQPTQPMTYMQAPTMANGVSRPSRVPPPPSPRAVVAPPASMPVPAPASVPGPVHQREYSTSVVPNSTPIAQPAPVSLTRNTSGKMFTPFRLLSKRHRTVSTASVDAVDGTINAMLTGGDSTRSSTAGRPSPPLRDPMTAAQEWRNQEEVVQQGRGTLRRRRPGVTFDIGEEVPEDGKPSLQKTLRANLAAMAAAQAQGQAPNAQTQDHHQQQQLQPQQPQAVQAHQTYQTQTAQHQVQGYPGQASYSQGQPLPTRQVTA